MCRYIMVFISYMQELLTNDLRIIKHRQLGVYCIPSGNTNNRTIFSLQLLLTSTHVSLNFQVPNISATSNGLANLDVLNEDTIKCIEYQLFGMLFNQFAPGNRQISLKNFNNIFTADNKVAVCIPIWDRVSKRFRFALLSCLSVMDNKLHIQAHTICSYNFAIVITLPTPRSIKTIISHFADLLFLFFDI